MSIFKKQFQKLLLKKGNSKITEKTFINILFFVKKQIKNNKININILNEFFLFLENFKIGIFLQKIPTSKNKKRFYPKILSKEGQIKFALKLILKNSINKNYIYEFLNVIGKNSKSIDNFNEILTDFKQSKYNISLPKTKKN